MVIDEKDKEYEPEDIKSGKEEKSEDEDTKITELAEDISDSDDVSVTDITSSDEEDALAKGIAQIQVEDTFKKLTQVKTSQLINFNYLYNLFILQTDITDDALAGQIINVVNNTNFMINEFGSMQNIAQHVTKIDMTKPDHVHFFCVSNIKNLYVLFVACTCYFMEYECASISNYFW
jgi:hypothetical protein